MELISKEILKNIPNLYETQDLEDPLCHIKLFTPDANFTWYIIEVSIDENLCYGYVKGLENELGYFSLDEIVDIRGSLGLKVEIDSSFTPRLLSKVRSNTDV
jgi:hypothetical protein